MTFAELLKSKDMTGARLARKIGVTKESVCNWTRGKNSPSNVIIVANIAKALGTDMETVLNSLLKTVENKKI